MMVFHPVALGVSVLFGVATISGFGDEGPHPWGVVIGSMIAAVAAAVAFWPFEWTQLG